MCYNWNCYNNTRGAFLFIEPARKTHKILYGQSPRNLGKPRYCCSKRTGSLSCGDFAIMTRKRKSSRPCKKCGTSEWYDSGNCKRCSIDRATQWQKDNPEKRGGFNRNWQRNNPEKVRGYSRIWKKNNPEKRAVMDSRRRTRKTEAGGSYTASEFKALCKQYGNRCACCGKKKPLEFDHVIPVTKGGSSDISNGQPLCRSCNSSKGTKTTDYRTKPGIKRWIQKRLFGE